MEKFKNVLSFIKQHKNLFFLLFLAGLAVYICILLTYTYITVQFKDLRPVREKIEVYYKGIKVGQVQSMRHSEDYKFTLVNLVLYPKNLNLPINTIAKFKKEKRKDKDIDYIELIYPKEPSGFLINDGTKIAGETTIDGETYLANIDPNEVEEIKNNLKNASENLNTALSTLGDLFTTLDDMVKQNQGNLQTSSKNLARTSNNINQMTAKLNNSLKQENLDSTVSNIQDSSANIKESTKNLQTMTGNLDSTTVGINKNLPKIESTLNNAECAAQNLNEITYGLTKTLKKRFGGLRILFGRTIQSDAPNYNNNVKRPPCGCR